MSDTVYDILKKECEKKQPYLIVLFEAYSDYEYIESMQKKYDTILFCIKERNTNDESFLSSDELSNMLNYTM